MSEPDYQLMAEQINRAMGYAYTGEYLKALIASTVRKPITAFEFSNFALRPGETVYLSAKFHTEPERVYRVNPRMSSVDMLRQAVHDAQNRKGDIR